MIQLDIPINTVNLLFSFLFYFFSLIFFIFSRFYFFAKSFILLMCLSLIIILYNYYYLFFTCTLGNANIYYNLIDFTQTVGLLTFNLSFSINPLTYLFSLLVLIIGLGTNIYTLNYFKNEADEMGFLFWLNCFILSMVILVLGDNFLTIFLGWELIGFTSFFLINFWQSRRSTLKSSFKAFSFNLVSDLLLLTFMIIMYSQYHVSNIEGLLTLLAVPGLVETYWLKVATVCLIACASVKSVQIIGHLWLPDSMEAPVPASSLIHSATLVSAGIFLLLRFNTLIFFVNYQNFIISIGALTAAYGGLVAAAQTDVKKLLAYSTMSHCGFLFVLTGLGDSYITIIYLFLHGLFKASTFFCVGSFIRVYGTQDTRLMGGANRLLWGDTLLLFICSSNLCGLPLTIGFIYKYYFFKILFVSNIGFIELGLFYLALLSSLLYFYRLIYYSVFDRWKLLWGTSPFLVQALHTQDKKDKRISLYKKHRSASRVTTFGHWFAVLFILIISFYVYFLINYFTVIMIRLDDVITSYTIKSNLLLDFFFLFYNTYLIYFYLFYIILFIALSFITWRRNFFFFDKITVYILLLLSSFSLVFYIICGVRS